MSAKQLGWITCGPVTYAITPFGSYEVRPNTGNTTGRFEVSAPIQGNSIIGVGSDEAKMRNLAQSDYEKRIQDATKPTVTSPPTGLDDLDGERRDG